VNDWRDSAKCRGLDGDLFFGPVDSKPDERLYGWERRALAICAGCPVRAECVADALTFPVDEQHGVVGGQPASHRRELLKFRYRARAVA